MKKVITINRQYGSGGREIGRRLAEIYDIPFYDNEIISKAAKETGFAEAAFERRRGKSDKQSFVFDSDGDERFFDSGDRICRDFLWMTGFFWHRQM